MLASTITYFILRTQNILVYACASSLHSILEKEINMCAIDIASRNPKESSDFPCLLPFNKKPWSGPEGESEVIKYPRYVLSIFAVNFQ